MLLRIQRYAGVQTLNHTNMIIKRIVIQISLRWDDIDRRKRTI